MKIAVASPRQMHAVILLNVLASRGDQVAFYTSSPRSKLGDLNPAVDYRFSPKPLEMLAQLAGKTLTPTLIGYDAEVFDRQIAARIPEVDVFYGFALSSLRTGKLVSRRGGGFILDRACPFVDFQEPLISEEARKVGAIKAQQPAWYRERQLQEYETASVIVVPSDYTRRSFPMHLRNKIVVAPIRGRTLIPTFVEPKETGKEFVVGVVGGDPLRKGTLYLLQAWKKLALPNARLKIRSGSVKEFPVLQKLLEDQPSIELIQYVPDLNQFYQQCDAFVLPSVDDGFGMAIFEAMGNGVPTILTTNCGASELMTHNKDGLIIEPFNVDQIVESILALYHSPDLRRRIGLAGRETVIRVGDGKNNVYEHALGLAFNHASNPLKLVA